MTHMHGAVCYRPVSVPLSQASILLKRLNRSTFFEHIPSAYPPIPCFKGIWVSPKITIFQSVRNLATNLADFFFFSATARVHVDHRKCCQPSSTVARLSRSAPTFCYDTLAVKRRTIQRRREVLECGPPASTCGTCGNRADPVTVRVVWVPAATRTPLNFWIPRQ